MTPQLESLNKTPNLIGTHTWANIILTQIGPHLVEHINDVEVHASPPHLIPPRNAYTSGIQSWKRKGVYLGMKQCRITKIGCMVISSFASFSCQLSVYWAFGPFIATM